MNDICGVHWIDGSLRATPEGLAWLQKASDGEFEDKSVPEMLPHVRDDGTVEMNWHGMGAAESLGDGTLVEFLSHTAGRAEFALVDEYGEEMRGVRVNDGKTTFHVVKLVLGEEISDDG